MWFAVGLIACGGGEGGRTTVAVFAASSLSEAFGEMASVFEAKHPRLDVQLNVAGSSTLREQILQGAPADVFASANETTMAALEAAGELSSPPSSFATNALEIAVPVGNPGGVSSIDDLARSDLLVGLCATGVPCGDFARAVLERAGVVPAVDTNESDVRALLTKIGADELDVGIVYVTDVIAADDRVEGIEIPLTQNVVATYPIAEVRAGPNPTGGAEFVAFVLSPDGQMILRTFGFGAP